MPTLAESSPGAGDRTLLDDARRGNLRALRWLYEQHAPAVSRFLRGLLRDQAAASDALQETFARAFRRLDTVTDSDRLLSWLLGIARFVAHEHYRSGKRTGEPTDMGSVELRHDLNPEVALLGKESARRVERAMAEMGEGRREALLLRIDQGLAYQEIAEVLGWSLSKAKVEVHRAREILRAVLASDEEEHR